MSVIDFHTHILPLVDDGSDSLETSALMLEAQKKQGVEKVIATPHFYANYDKPERFLEKRKQSVQMLLQGIKDLDNMPEIKVGAEVYYFEGMSDCEYLKDMAIEGTKCVMIEMPFKHWSDYNLNQLEGIRQKLGLTPIIAHIDRYIRPLSQKKTFERLERLPVLIQANASFFVNKSTRRFALKLFRQGKIQLIGSDCHNLTSRAPNLSGAIDVIKQNLGENAIAHINHFERKVLGN